MSHPLTIRLVLRCSHAIRPYSTTAGQKHESEDAYKRRRKTEWKRKQGGQTFLDHLIVNIRAGKTKGFAFSLAKTDARDAGKGGDGCVAFHREKFKPNGPPSGGDGGRGADVYLLPTRHLTSLSSVPPRIRAQNGAHGQGTWQKGKSAPPLVIQVPLGTVVRQLPRGDSRRAPDEWEAEEESLDGLDPETRREKMRAARWLHYPLAGDVNVEKDSFKEAEVALYKQERERRIERRKREAQGLIFLDLEKEVVVEKDVNAPLGIRQREPQGYLVAGGGQGGLGNPHFISSINRSPKFGSRGQEGERITLELELKILADIGLVGMPNVGKSTLLRALTGGRAKSAVANYAFTTLNPVLGVVRVAKDGTYEGKLMRNRMDTYDETEIEEAKDWEKMVRGDYAHALTRNQKPSSSSDEMVALSLRPGHGFDLAEDFRFTVADNPGLIAGASENIGLGHEFLRSVERALALVYVVDLSSAAPWEELATLQSELEDYMPGLSKKARMVIANKADLLVSGDHNEGANQDQANDRLRRLEAAAVEVGHLDVVPVSAKFSQNLSKVVSLMKIYVQQASIETGHARIL